MTIPSNLRELLICGLYCAQSLSDVVDKLPNHIRRLQLPYGYSLNYSKLPSKLKRLYLYGCSENDIEKIKNQFPNIIVESKK